MDEVIHRFNTGAVRYLVMGGQAMRLMGMPRFSMDWDFYVPPRDQENFDRINEVLDSELDAAVVPLGERGENFVQTYQTVWGVLQFHLLVPGVPKFEIAEAAFVTRHTEGGAAVRCLSPLHLLSAKQAANRPQDQLDIEFLLSLRQRRSGEIERS